MRTKPRSKGECRQVVPSLPVQLPTAKTKHRRKGECEHDFVLVLSEHPELTTEGEEALFEAGCDDATISVRSGRVFLTFSRTASSLKEAVLSAIRDVKKAKIGAEVLRVDQSNLVSQADIARRIQRSRQLVHQFISGTRGPGNFPPPACVIADDAPLWYWSEVALWLWQNNMIRENAVRAARDVAAINAILEMRYHQRSEPKLIEEVTRAFDDASAPKSARAKSLR